MIGIFLLIFSAVVSGYIQACRDQPEYNKPKIWRQHESLLRGLAYVPLFAVLWSSFRTAGWWNVLGVFLLWLFLSFLGYIAIRRWVVTNPTDF